MRASQSKLKHQTARRSSKKEFDENRETLHNLTSLLLTNTTICQAQQAVPN
jgi:hypothetical protein